jgi:hypothetical protein
MRPWAYYALSGVLLLVTVPMYRYIFVQAAGVPVPRAAPDGPSPFSSASVTQARVLEVSRIRAADAYARRLSPDMRCVGGVVIKVEGSTYSQVGTRAYPVRCSGRWADRPIR